MAVFEEVKSSVMWSMILEISKVGITIPSFQDTVLRNGKENFVHENEVTA